MEVATTTSLVLTGARTGSSRDAALRLQILGPLRLWRGGEELDAGPRQQAYLLALLLARAGVPVSKAELVELIWGDSAPASAVNVIHKYVGALRRLLEPELPARGTSTYLVGRSSGYLCAADAATLDLVAFRQLWVAGREAKRRDRPEEALDHYSRALELWQGRAGDGLAVGPEAVPVFAGLDAEFLDAGTAAAELAVAAGTPERVLAPLQLAASIGPLHEPVQAALVSVLGAAGRQAEALSVFRAVRERLVDELGIDPGAVLERAHERVLRQSAAPVTVAGSAAGTGSPREGGAPAPARSGEDLVGRVADLTVLRDALERTSQGGTELVVVEGEPGVGKTRLMEEVAGDAAGRGALVAWGRCTDGEGTPSMWPWAQVVGAVLEGLSLPEREAWRADGIGDFLEPRDGALTAQVLPGGNGQFRLFERIVGLIGHVSARRPVLLVVDDLHWADTASLGMFSHLAEARPPGLLLLGALRDRAPAPGSELGRTLARAGRTPSHRRLRVGPLGAPDVAELVRRELGRTPDTDTVRTIHARTSGNPFFVRELSRLLATASPALGRLAARSGVPSTVRDVVRDRMAGLGQESRNLLEIAALIGREVDLGLLARVADVGGGTCLAGVEPAETLGFLVPVRGNPYAVRFVHDLVRESVSEATPPRHASRLHLRVADALEEDAAAGESAPEQIAHHLWAAGPLAEPSRTVRALLRSGRRAAAKSALEASEQDLRLAVQVARSAGLAERELAALSELIAVIGMRSMYAGAEVELLERAELVARSLGRDAEAAGFLYSRWAAYAQGIDLKQTGRLARRLLTTGESSPHPIVRTYGLHAWGIHQWDLGNIGEAFRYLSRSEETLLADAAGRDDNPVQFDLQLLMTGLLAETTALHGDVPGAQVLLDRLEAAGTDHYTVTVWATMSTRIAVIVGDPQAAMEAAERGIAVDPDFSYVFLGTYQRLARCWGRALTGTDPAGAAEQAERIIEKNLLDPVRSCVSTWYALLGDMHLAAGDVPRAATAMDRADHCLRAYGQRYSQGLLLLLRARLRQAQGRPAAAVREAVQLARRVSAHQQAHLFVQRADAFLQELDEDPGRG
ncbi:ATP-binding protein [Myceligenerans indicum]|uniref:AAA family ATPase n=1 Tax=Myceligenerans indicum TaxID=2593663 RepID=A0ABS1LQA2_9MICO|nr:BTAD domain-containing putative transcriptional regulator [Myceligenerans indicum]MBL0888223.1 AAA family ATPase [Myceligenerans indicum]